MKPTAPAKKEQRTQPRRAHVFALACDLVGFSKLNTPEEKEQVEKMLGVLEACPAYAGVRAEVTRLDTGDGFVLLFPGISTAAMECGLELLDSFKEASLRARFGLHFGLVEWLGSR